MIDVASIDREQFAVVEDPHGHDEVLVVARRGKYSYNDLERRLRALLVTRSGEVLSTGYPKFDNYGESPEIDAAFDRAFALGRATFREKIDGTLIIADVIRGEVRLRTRGRPTVEWERDAFESLLAREYPELRERLAREPMIREHSILIECALVERPLVIRYEQSKLTLVGLVHKQRIEPVIDVAVEEAVAARLGLEVAPLVTVNSPEELQEIQRAKGREGLVARFRDGEGEASRTLMVKLKSLDFFRLHGLRARLNEPRVRQIALILDLREEDDFLRMTAKYGLDWEAAQMALPFLSPMLAKRREAHLLFDALKTLLAPSLGERSASDKPAYVRRLREIMASDARFSHKMWFYAGVEWFVRPEQARIVVDSNLFDEPITRIQEWATDPDRYVRALIEPPSERVADEA